MQTIQHKTLGKGEVISKRVGENEIYLTVRFSSGKEMKLAAESFKGDFFVAEGDLKEEIDAVLAVKNAAEEARNNAIAEAASTATPSVVAPKRGGRQPNQQVIVKGSIQTQYEEYLKAAGYPVIGRTGKESTVPAYVYAVEQVLREENLTWAELEKNISQIVTKYDVGGECEDFGARSNRRVINALKRFAEFVEAAKNIAEVEA